MTRERAIEVLKAWDLNWSDEFTANEFEQAFAMAISALSENTGEWIPVTERLPKIADVYRVTRYFPNGVMHPRYLVDACFFDGSNTWYNDNRINHERAYANNVIAWQENPEPYKADMRGDT